jgi:hypothetical protein
LVFSWLLLKGNEVEDGQDQQGDEVEYSRQDEAHLLGAHDLEVGRLDAVHRTGVEPVGAGKQHQEGEEQRPQPQEEHDEDPEGLDQRGLEPVQGGDDDGHGQGDDGDQELGRILQAVGHILLQSPRILKPTPGIRRCRHPLDFPFLLFTHNRFPISSISKINNDTTIPKIPQKIKPPAVDRSGFFY